MKFAPCSVVIITVSACLIHAGAQIGIPPGRVHVTTVAPPSLGAQPDGQIARLSLVEGDVRVARGDTAKHATGGDWGHAVTGLPLESGFSLATGTGHAEIELEDASTVYLGDDSVLVLNKLSSTDSVPHTEMTLLSGTATLRVLPLNAGETFLVATPAGRLSFLRGDHALVRVNSYLDAMSVTSLQSSVYRINRLATHTGSEVKTITYYADAPGAQKRWPQVSPDDTGTGAFAEWDKWTVDRVAARDTAMAEMMEAAGVTVPIPGLAELNGRGSFFDCGAGLGTCWEPTGGWSGGERNDTAAREVSFALQRRASPMLLMVSQNTTAGSLGQTPGKTRYRQEYELLQFPCYPAQIRRLIARDLSTGLETVVRADLIGSDAPYAFAACHTGAWIHRQNRYVWAVGTGVKRHHHCPVHWVKSGKLTGFVPVHPRDAAGKPPVNLEHGLFALSGHKDETVEHVAYNPGAPIKVLDLAPKEFLTPHYPKLERAQEPRLTAYMIGDGAGAKDGLKSPMVAGKTAVAGAPIAFDHQSQSFLIIRRVIDGGHNATLIQSFGARSGSGEFRITGSGLSYSNSSFNSGNNYRAGTISSSSSSSGEVSRSSGASTTYNSPPAIYTSGVSSGGTSSGATHK